MEENQLLIFDIPKQDVLITNENQKILEYEKREKNSLIDGFHFKSFYEMEEYEIQMNLPDTNVLSLLLKYCINYVNPIINQDIDKSNKENKVKSNILQLEEQYHITLQHEEPILCYINNTYIKGGKEKNSSDSSKKNSSDSSKISEPKTRLPNKDFMEVSIIPSNKQMNIVGFVIPDKLVRIYNHSVVYFEHLDLHDFSQCYSLYNFQTLRFAQQFITNFGLEFHLNKNKTTIFFDEKDAMNKIKILIKYLLIMYDFYSSNFLLTSLEMSDYFHKIFKHILFTKNEYKKLDSIEEKISSIFKLTIKNSFNVGRYLFLENNNFDYIYNIGKILGIDSESFTSLLDKKKENYKNNEKFIEWKHKGFKQKLQIIQKKLIAFDKYGIDVLDELDKKQLSVVNLEYNKKINREGVNEENQKLFNEFEKSFNDISNENIKKNLSKIKALFPNLRKQLEVGLRDDGICYHLIRQAEVILQHFKQKDLNPELFKMFTEEFSLPKSTSGYFCKICGEQLLEADNEGVVRFNEKGDFYLNDFDNPIKTLIWKETVFIITTYVKFIKPMPIKPLINSIVNGLYEVIHEEEVRLLNNKTNIAANIRDVLIIFANVYIYAILSVMILHNPTKMMFGRDDPNKKKNDRERDKNKTVDQIETVNNKTVDQIENVNNTTREQVETIKENDLLESSEYLADNESDNNYKHKNKKHKDFKYKGGAITNDKKVYEKFLLMTSINLILFSKDIIIKKSPLFNADNIREEFLQKAYPWALKILHLKDEKENQDQDSIIRKIEQGDSFYEYIYFVKKLYKQNLKHDDFISILGRTETQINTNNKTVSPYGTIKLPERFKRSTYNDYAWESFMSIYEYTVEEISEHNYLRKSPVVNDYYAKYSNLLSMQKKIMKEEKKKETIPSFKLPFYNKQFDHMNLDLTQFYCSSGQKHKINILVFKDESKTIELSIKEAADIVKSKDDKKISNFARYKLINEKCENCKMTIRNSTIKDGELENFNHIFKKLDHVNAFFQYYKDRCPINELHEIKNDKCTKCDIGINELNNMDTKYYNKYVDRFKKIEGKNQGLLTSKLKQLNINHTDSKLNIDDNSKHKNKITFINNKYEYSMKNLAEWSKLSNIKYSLLLNLGLTEEYKWDEIEKNGVQPYNIITASEKKFINDKLSPDTIKFSPVTNPIEKDDPNVPNNFEESLENINLMDILNIKSKNYPNSIRFPLGMYKTQALKLKSYILQIIRTYNTIINYEDVAYISQEFKNIISLQKNISNVDIKKYMPNIADEFHKLDQEYKYKLTSKNYSNFLSESLANIFIKLHNINKTYRPLSDGLIKYFENLIMKQEKLFSKPEVVLYNQSNEIEQEDTNESTATDTTSGEFVREDHATPVQSDSNEEDSAKEQEKVLDDITFEDIDVENEGDVFELE